VLGSRAFRIRSVSSLEFQLLRSLDAGAPHSFAALASSLRAAPSALRDAALASRKRFGAALDVRDDAVTLEHAIDWLDAATRGEAAMSHGLRVEVVDECASTNSELLSRARQSDIHGHVLVAEAQSAGRGRRGRQWIAQLGRSLCFSLAWRFDRDVAALSGVSLALGVACACALEDLGCVGARLKWPNDLLFRDGKLGGILVEHAQGSHPTTLIIGIGLNVRGIDVESSDARLPMADLSMTGAALPSRTAILRALLDHLSHALMRFDEHGFEPFCEEWNARHAHADKEIQLSLNDAPTARGIAQGGAPDGSLIVRTAEGLRRFHGGEITLREAA